MTETVRYRCWCEHDGCDWSTEIEAERGRLAQEASSAAIVAHGLPTGHHETYRQRVDD